MKYSTNYNMNKPELSEQYRLEHWNDNTDIIDTELKRNADNITTAETALQNAINKESLRATNAETALQNITDSTFKTALLNFCYPVGSLYWSSKSTNPSTLFGGTWVQIKDRFVLTAGDTYANGATGGSATVKLTESNLPAHSHTCSSTDINHTHSGTTGTVTDKYGSAKTGAMNKNQSHTHSQSSTRCNAGNSFSGKVPQADHISDGSQDISNINSTNIDHTHNFDHAHDFTTGWMSVNWSHSHTVNGGGNGTANGNAHENMPPYIVKFCWERTA